MKSVSESTVMDLTTVPDRELHRLIYYSKMSDRIRRLDLRQILNTSRRNNDLADITGALVMDSRYFLQALEGRRDLLSRTFARIAQDKRHHGVTLISMGPAAERYFGEWCMMLVGGDRITTALCTETCGVAAFRPDLMTPAAAERFLAAILPAGLAKRDADLESEKLVDIAA